MHMCAVAIIEVVILVFAITGVGFLLGKLNKFGDRDDIYKEEK